MCLIVPNLTVTTKTCAAASCPAPGSYLGVVSLPEVVRQVVLDLGDELLGVVGVEAEHLAQAFEADVLEVTVGQGLHTGVGLDHFLLGQTVRANQVASTWKAFSSFMLIYWSGITPSGPCSY